MRRRRRNLFFIVFPARSCHMHGQSRYVYLTQLCNVIVGSFGPRYLGYMEDIIIQKMVESVRSVCIVQLKHVAHNSFFHETFQLSRIDFFNK